MITRTTTLGLRVGATADIDTVVTAIIDAARNHRKFLVTFANPGTVVMVQRSGSASRLFDKFDIVAPDGIAMVLAIRWLHRIPAARISFDTTSLAPLVLAWAAEQKLRIVLIGGQPGVPEQAAEQMRNKYPTLNIVGALHGYSSRTTTITTIKQLAPDMVICGMGNVLQEAFLLALVESGWSGVGITCGGYFDQLSRGFHYYPHFVNAWHLRWLYRLVKEPRRLWRRYLLDYPRFAVSLARTLAQR